ncbi:hypothetical protein MPU32_004552 [Escherichia coli]|nr:hypothetical protein [Escherichia coli]
MVLRAKLKLFCRPKALPEDRKGLKRVSQSEESSGWQNHADERHTIHFLIGCLRDGNEKIAMNNEAAQRLPIFMPGNEVQVKRNVVKVDSLNDWRSLRIWTINKKKPTAPEVAKPRKQILQRRNNRPSKQG